MVPPEGMAIEAGRLMLKRIEEMLIQLFLKNHYLIR